jgi:hypothetical protein
MGSLTGRNLIAERGAIVEVVSAIFPQTPFDDMVGVQTHARGATVDTFMSIPLKHSVSQ